jgi:peptidyl-prolyl cis-trans isomerase C
MRTHTGLKVSVVALAVLLSGCDREATGQVAAVVNGEEITLQEVNAELGAVQLPEGADESQVRQAVLQRIIDRRLLAQAAREEGLDKTPEFLVRSRQLEDALLVQLLSQKTGRTTAVPTADKVSEYISKNSAVFGGRTIFTIDRIQFAMPKNADVLKELEDDHSLEAVAAQLEQLGIEFTRDSAQMDSARLGQGPLNQIRALPEGEPFVLPPQAGVVTVGVIKGSTPRPVGEEQARPAAAQMMRNQSLGEALKQRLEAERAEAKIEYQEGFAPPAASKPTPSPSSVPR